MTLQHESKPGYLTTEFWTTLFVHLVGIIQLAGGVFDVNNKWVVLAMAIVQAVYNVSRGVAKHGLPEVTLAVPVTQPATIAPDVGDVGRQGADPGFHAA